MSFYDVTRDELISGVDEVTSITASLEATRGAQILYIGWAQLNTLILQFKIYTVYTVIFLI
jgi:hypothetical protein